jgi:hypothetical protein
VVRAFSEKWQRIITTWSRVIPETLILAELDQKFPVFSYDFHKIPSLGHNLKQINAIPCGV